MHEHPAESDIIAIVVYGICGVGAYCLGGCNPKYSTSLTSCVAEPACHSTDYKLTSLSGMTSNSQYLGDSTTSNWVYSGQPLAYQNSVLLTLPQNSLGTLLASTAYVWYGKVSVTMKSSRTAGVVTQFMLVSDVGDEIDVNFIGTDLGHVQSDYYYQGTSSSSPTVKNLTVSGGDTFGSFHTYTVDWTPDQITWSVDGTPLRVLKKTDTFNANDNKYHYPQTPARVELNLWPAGLPSNSPGTIAYGGGLINWNSADPKTVGYFYAQIQDVNVQCYAPPAGTVVSGSKSYVYTARDGGQSAVKVTNNPTTLKSLSCTGTNPNCASVGGIISLPLSSSAIELMDSRLGASGALKGDPRVKGALEE